MTQTLIKAMPTALTRTGYRKEPEKLVGPELLSTHPFGPEATYLAYGYYSSKGWVTIGSLTKPYDAPNFIRFSRKSSGRSGSRDMVYEYKLWVGPKCPHYLAIVGMAEKTKGSCKLVYRPSQAAYTLDLVQALAVKGAVESNLWRVPGFDRADRVGEDLVLFYRDGSSSRLTKSTVSL